MTAIRIKEVIQNVRLSQSTIYAMLVKDQFANSFELTPRRAAWLENGIHSWLAKKAGPSLMTTNEAGVNGGAAA